MSLEPVVSATAQRPGGAPRLRVDIEKQLVGFRLAVHLEIGTEIQPMGGRWRDWPTGQARRLRAFY